MTTYPVFSATEPQAPEHSPRRRHSSSRLSPEGLERLRASARVHRAWEKSTGPRTPQGKFRSAQNGRLRQKAERSVRELRAELASIFTLIHEMGAARNSLTFSEPRLPD